MRNLATVQRITKLEPIEGADKIEKAYILGWEVVVNKGEFKEQELCIYCEIDSVLPEKPEFEFLRNKKFRIRTIKLRGVISQGIAFPLSILPNSKDLKEGQDVTEEMGITKYDPESEVKMCKQVKKIIYPKWIPWWICKFINKTIISRLYKKTSKDKPFPSACPKSDETRIQVLQPLLDKYHGTLCYDTEKLDGSSITLYLINGKFGVCSRNIDLYKDPKNIYWETVINKNLERKIKEYFKGVNIMLQGELIGPGIQGNKYNLSERDIRFFNIFYVKHQEYGDVGELSQICFDIQEQTVPILEVGFKLTNSIPELVERARGNSLLNPNIPREGIVIRPVITIEDGEFSKQLVKKRISFKSINPDFLLKYE